MEAWFKWKSDSQGKYLDLIPTTTNKWMNKILKIKITQVLWVVVSACKHKWSRGKHRRVTGSNLAQEKVEKIFTNTK
jgi:hypothetical protein